MKSELIEQVWLEVDEFVEAFELAWTADAVPEIPDFLPEAVHPQFHETLLELVRVDLELRWQHGCAKTLDAYRRAFPALLDDAESLSRVAFEEFRARRQAGELVSADEYAIRYGIHTNAWPAVTIANPLSQSGAKGSTGRRHAGELTSSDFAEFPQVGTEWRNFFLQGELGRGTFSRVYLARQGDLANRLVVLKVSAESFAEADKLAQLQHANIVPIYSVHQVGNLSAVCMPYFGAATLADVVREIHGLKSLPPSGRAIVETLTACGRRTEMYRCRATPDLDHSEINERSGPRMVKAAEDSPSESPGCAGTLKTLSGLSYVEAVLWIGAKLADGLSHAHERGILHRDLKPANVLMADDGRPMLLDFNLSTDLKPGAKAREMLVGGTLPYMAPEQIDAFQHQIHAGDPRSDIYSLGVILFELLAGRNPFPIREGSLEQILAHMRQDRLRSPPRLRRLNPVATPAVEAIIQRCLAAEPVRRYQTAAELHEDLERHLKQLPLRHSREPSLRERAHKWTRRHSRLTTVIALTMLVTGVGLAVGEYQENKRIAAAEVEIAGLMKAGREALDDAEVDVAHGRFLAAWMKVQAEPALIDHQLGVAGWLDHSRRAIVQKQWKQRVPPREYDERRDEALLFSLLLEPRSDQQAPMARDAIHTAIDLTIPGDPGWTQEREQLTLVEADLIALESGAKHALTFLDATNEFSSRQFHECRAGLLELLGRSTEAAQARQAAAQFPPYESTGTFLSGMDRVRRREFDLALQDFEQVLNFQPESFATRLFQAICFLHLNRPGEARVALTSCIAQRPHCLWSYVFRSQASVALGDRKAALVDLHRVLDTRPSGPLEQATRVQLEMVHAVSVKPVLSSSSDAN